MRRATRPRSPTAPRRSSSPPPATTCASRCTPWACSPRPCARAPTTPRSRSSSTASTSRSTRSRACSPSCSTSAASTAAASRCNPENFELADIFRKVRLHFEPAAFEKGLALRIRGGRHVALADPLLVERIVRNLVSNAIRYTAGRLGPAQLPAPRRAAAAPGLGHRPGHPRRGARAHLRGVLSGAGRGGGHGRAEEGPRPRPGDRQAALRADGGAARPALAGRPRLGVHGRAAARQRRRARRRDRSRARGRSASRSTAA